MNYIKIFILTIITAFMVSSCSNQTTAVGKGDVESMAVETPAFTGVSVTGTCDVDIKIGEIKSVVLNAQSEILDVMTYEVRDNILHIGFKPNYTVNTSEEISADITIPSVSFVAITGVGDFELEGAKQEFLDINITGSGNVSAFDMEVTDCQIKISGTGNCEVNVINSLDVRVSGVGNIFYKGSPPSVTQKITGVGNVTGVDL